METFRFTPRRIRVHSGETVTWNNHTTDGHSVSVVPRDQLPKTAGEVANCAACGPFFVAHFLGGPGSPPVRVLDDFKRAAGPATFDSVGDSLLVGTPELGLPPTASARVTAPAGTTLTYLCIFHPRMQATIDVVGADQDN